MTLASMVHVRFDHRVVAHDVRHRPAPARRGTVAAASYESYVEFIDSLRPKVRSTGAPKATGQVSTAWQQQQRRKPRVQAPAQTGSGHGFHIHLLRDVTKHDICQLCKLLEQDGYAARPEAVEEGGIVLHGHDGQPYKTMRLWSHSCKPLSAVSSSVSPDDGNDAQDSEAPLVNWRAPSRDFGWPTIRGDEMVKWDGDGSVVFASGYALGTAMKAHRWTPWTTAELQKVAERVREAWGARVTRVGLHDRP